ncbi:hypothetical protein RUM43_005882 [Polyplax serrata]|uniref:N-acetyltransferase domain-containing protein n=1 Tax=Polyplax serrata TaxID=468196 RepID=A0AAN8S1S6_POLSC
MKLNENTVIRGNSTLLVPYEEWHVPKYHEWMKSEELQLLTASEPLSLEDEYDMQKTWRLDPDIKYHLKQVTNDEVLTGEVEIMIAEENARGKGLGKEALLMMLRYCVNNLGVNCFEAKIGISNYPSISLFSKIGFEKIDENKIFKEYTFTRSITESWMKWLESETQFYVEDKKLK